MWLALMPNMSIKTAGGPLRGIPVTASRVRMVLRQQLTAPATASPMPPRIKNNRNVRKYLKFHIKNHFNLKYWYESNVKISPTSKTE
ncbi:hypothetical protein TNCV_1490411 [Trichonephila clavipes]|nr:hypothetical protein TNCV_1490411 [Trichonephila clavipes]